MDDSKRLGSQGADDIKSHPWFTAIDWKGLTDRTFPVPDEVISRINQHLENHTDDAFAHPVSPVRDIEGLDTPEWLEDW